uniref:Tubulin-like protein n=1 Tax=Cyanothece sp. (strain PCC 7425 / ATCC 29141) TaxID=395961 RepID=B8HTJ0_CYAP4
MDSYVGMTPTVVIGLGGTGKEIMIKIRRMIVESYGSLEALPIVAFLHVDTEQNAKVSEPQVVLKQNIALSSREQVWAKVEDAKAILNKLSAYDYLEEWFPPQLKGTDSILAGAGQIRALGKLAFTLNFQNIKTAFNNAKAQIVGHEKFMLDRWNVQLDKGVNIFVVCSLSGGTGSGMLLDMAYNLRDWLPPSDLPQTSAYLVLPGAFSGLGDRVVANAYAALMELNHFSQGDTRFEAQYGSSSSDRISTQSGQDVPFNFCYLVGNSNDKVTFANLGAVFEMVAQNIFLDFSSGFSQYKKLVRDNLRKQWASPDPLGYPQNFITFGLSSIQFPVERVLNACALRLASQLINWWANPTPAPTSMQDLIRTEILPSLNLAESSEQHQLLDSIALGDNNKPYSKEVADWVAYLRKRRNDLNIPYENLQRFISVEQEKYDPHFNDSNTDPKRWSDYYQKMWDNLNVLMVQKRQELRQTVYKIIEDRFRGPKFARQFLEVLIDVFADFRSQFDQSRQKDWIPRERSAANALQTLLVQIDTHAKQFLLINRKSLIEEDFRGIMNALESLYVSKVEVKARTLGVQLLDGLKEEIDLLLIDLTVFEKNLDNLQKGFADREQSYVGETGTLTVNGILLYNRKDIDQIYSKTIQDKQEIIYQSISQAVLTDLNLRLFDLFTFDTLRLKDVTIRILDRTLDQFVGSPHLQISTARKFLEQYPTLEQQEAQIKTTFEKSESFLRFSQEQARLGWEDKAEKRQTLIGIQGGTKPTDPAVEAILPMIRKSGTVTDKDIRPLNDPHHIYFIQEKGAFPLRLIEGMERMRTLYRAVIQTDPNPLHTHQEDRQFRDIMPPTQAEVAVKQNIYMARALGLITAVNNNLTGFAEIRFSYLERATGLERLQVLGSDWEEVENFFLSDQNRRINDLLIASLQQIGNQPTKKPEKQALYQQLMDYLKQIETQLPGGKDNPEYGNWESAIADYVKTYGLFVGVTSNPEPQTSTPSPSPNTPNTPTSPPVPATVNNSAAEDSNLQKFRKLVETCYRKGQPSPTELDLLEKLRLKYNVSEADAQALIAQFTPKTTPEENIYEYALMYRAFLDNDREVDLEEQAQLLELQEELGLSDEEVTTIQANVREELGLT